jgi:phosphohistidine phosphatase
VPAEGLEPAEAATAEAEAAAGVDEPVKQTGGDEPAEERGTKVELYLLRHADAGDPQTWKGDDADRPLSGKGRKQARRIGRWLADLGRRPDVILTSPKARALQTATIVAASLGVKPKVDKRLGGPLDHDVLRALLEGAGQDARRVMLVGHDPDFSSMASSLCGGPIALRKGALARIDLTDGMGMSAGTLRWLVPAEALPDR